MLSISMARSARNPLLFFPSLLFLCLLLGWGKPAAELASANLFVINSTADSDQQPGTLRHALATITNLSAAGSENSITFASNVRGEVIKVTALLPVLACGCSVSISASGGAAVTLDGQTRFNFFVLDQATNLSFVTFSTPLPPYLDFFFPGCRTWFSKMRSRSAAPVVVPPKEEVAVVRLASDLRTETPSRSTNTAGVGNHNPSPHLPGCWF